MHHDVNEYRHEIEVEYVDHLKKVSPFPVKPFHFHLSRIYSRHPPLESLETVFSWLNGSTQSTWVYQVPLDTSELTREVTPQRSIRVTTELAQSHFARAGNHF